MIRTLTITYFEPSDCTNQGGRIPNRDRDSQSRSGREFFGSHGNGTIISPIIPFNPEATI
jgi:hypothetical protein